MKNYDEMAEDVFRRIHAYNVEKKKKRKRLQQVLLVTTCLCFVILISVGVWKRFLLDPVPEPTHNSLTHTDDKNPNIINKSNSAQETEPFVYLCSMESDGQIQSELLQANNNYDSKFYLNFTNIKGLTEDQIMQKLSECEEAINKILSMNDSPENGYHYGSSILREEGYIVSRIAENYFTLNLENIDEIQSITISNKSPYGQIDVFGIEQTEKNYVIPHGKNIILEKEQINSNLTFSWNYYHIDEYFNQTAKPSYTDFDDTFYFMVEYDNGTQFTTSIDILFDEMGKATIHCNDYQTTTI